MDMIQMRENEVIRKFELVQSQVEQTLLEKMKVCDESCKFLA